MSSEKVINQWKSKTLKIELLEIKGKRGIGVKINGIYVGILRRYGTLPEHPRFFRLYITVNTGNGREQSIPMFFTKKQDFNKVEKMMEKYKPKKGKGKK